MAIGDDGGGASPDSFTLAGPPPKQPAEPGVVIVGTAALALVFGVADPSA